MIDVSKIKYSVIVIDETGNQYKINDYIQNLGWEENENEIAARFSFTARNDNTSKGYLSGIIKPGCLIGIFAFVDSPRMVNEEICSGYVETWNDIEQNSGHTLKCLGYDGLYKLQKSQDNLYFPSGTGTESAIKSILKEWGVPLGQYDGPNAVHGNLVYKNQYLSDIILEILDDSYKKGEKKCIIRFSDGGITIIPRGSNKTVYVFRADNTKAFNTSVSTADMVTRVKIVGKEKKDGSRSVEATLDGLTQFGIRQKIYTRGSDESLADANIAAQEILNDEGAVKWDMIVQSPDVPFIHKGDLVYIISGTETGHFYVKSIQHDIDNRSMTMGVEKAEEKSIGEREVNDEKSYEVGDVVNFHGGKHYVSSHSDSRGYNARAGKAKITQKNGAGKSHPWHLIHTDSKSNVYGWVDDGTFD
jgi:hypothetical protein